MARSEFGSISPEGRGKWRIRVSAGSDPATGKRRRVSRTVRGTKKDAVAELLRMQAEAGDPSRSLSDITVGTFVTDVYLPRKLEEVERGEYRLNSYSAVSSDLLRHVVPGIGHIRMRDLTPYAVEAWLAGIEKPAARWNAYSRWRTMHRQAARWGLADADVAKRAKPPRHPYPETKVLDAENLADVLSAFRGERIEPYVLLMAGCGLRLSEACGLNWEDIDFENLIVSVSRTFHRTDCVSYFAPTKTTRSRALVSVPPMVAKRLAEIMESKGAAPEDALAPTRGKHGRIYSSYAWRLYRNVWERKGIGVEFVTLKNLRHTHATILKESGADVADIAERLRHTSISTSMRYYIKARKVVDNRMSEAFEGAMSGFLGPSPSQTVATD